MRTRVLTLLPLAGALLLGLLAPAPAQADARVAVANRDGRPVVDRERLTTLEVSGRGFESVRGGFGGIYVFFGTVDAGWRPSQGGVTGQDYYYVPDSQARDNAGYQRFVAFPGSDTADSANGGTLSASGTWSTRISVPGAVFTAVDRDGAPHEVDCTRVTCGIITIGAHGVANAANESFTPVSVGDLAATAGPTAAPTAAAPTPSAVPTTAAAPTPAEAPGTAVAVGAPPVLDVDRASARAGSVLAFTATGLPAGSQVSAVLDDGVAGAGPFAVGPTGQLAGVVTLPPDLAGGTHELRLYGVDPAPTVSFGVAGTGDETAAAAPAGREPEDTSWAGPLFAALAGLVLLGALLRLAAQHRRSRRAPPTSAVVGA